MTRLVVIHILYKAGISVWEVLMCLKMLQLKLCTLVIPFKASEMTWVNIMIIGSFEGWYTRSFFQEVWIDVIVNCMSTSISNHIIWWAANPCCMLLSCDLLSTFNYDDYKKSLIVNWFRLLYQLLFIFLFIAAFGWACILIKLSTETRNAGSVQVKKHSAWWKIRSHWPWLSVRTWSDIRYTDVPSQFLNKNLFCILALTD